MRSVLLIVFEILYFCSVGRMFPCPYGCGTPAFTRSVELARHLQCYPEGLCLSSYTKETQARRKRPLDQNQNHPHQADIQIIVGNHPAAAISNSLVGPNAEEPADDAALSNSLVGHYVAEQADEVAAISNSLVGPNVAAPADEWLSPGEAVYPPPVSISQAAATAQREIECLLVGSLSENKMRRLFDIFKAAPADFSYKPSETSHSVLISKLLADSREWEEINVTEALGCTHDKIPQYVLVRADLQQAVQDLLIRHPAVIHPAPVLIEVDGTSERVISEFFTADLHIETQEWHQNDRGDDSVSTIMIKLWSDETALGGGDRLPVRVVLASLGNHPLAFSKSSQGQTVLALMNSITQGAGNQILLVLSITFVSELCNTVHAMHA